MDEDQLARFLDVNERAGRQPLDVRLGNMSEAARILGIDRSTVRRRLD